jgi:hypothetical protein
VPTELLLRFALGGAMVVLFGLVGAAVEPKTFAGIFGAAPSIALASLALSYASHGAWYVAAEARSMIGGAAALVLYSVCASALVKRHGLSPWLATIALWAPWLAVAALAFALLSRRP